MSKEKVPEMRTPRSDDARRSLAISRAYDLAEKRILEGTAKSAEIVHFLKMDSPKEKLERMKLEKEIELLEAKTLAVRQQQETDVNYAEVLAALRSYRGEKNEDEEDYSGYM